MVRPFGRVEADTATGLSGRSQVLRLMRSMDVLLLLHGTEPICAEYIPSKLYEYLWMQRPILALVHENPQMTELLLGQGHRTVEISLEPSVVPALTGVLEVFCDHWQHGGLRDNRRYSAHTVGFAVKSLMEWLVAAPL